MNYATWKPRGQVCPPYELNDEYFDFDFHCFKRIVFDLNNKLGLEEKTSPFINILGQTEFILNTSKVLSSNVT